MGKTVRMWRADTERVDPGTWAPVGCVPSGGGGPFKTALYLLIALVYSGYKIYFKYCTLGINV